MDNIELPFYAKTALILLATALVITLLYIGEIIIVPLIFALFAAIVLNPVVNFLTRHKIPRIISIFTGVFIAFVVTGAILFFIGLQVSMFSKTYPQLKEKFSQTTEQAINWGSEKFNIDKDKINEWLDNEKSEAIKYATGNMGNTLLTIGNFMVLVFLIPVYIFLILFYKSLLLEFIRKLFAVEHHKTVVEVLESIKSIIQSYLVGLLIEGAIVAVLNCIGLLILGVEYAIVLGITGAILNVIPYIGGFAAIALPMVIAYVTKSALSAVLVLIVYMVIQFIDNHYLVPYIVASKVKVNALIAIVVVLIGDLLWGVPGMFLSIPLIALVKVIFDHITPLKPYGFLLGDTMPAYIRLPFQKK